VLDRERLAGYVGHDAAFEAEFLQLLLGTVENCLASLAAPSLQIYATLHAAKAGIVVAAGDELRTQIEQACDLAMQLETTGWTVEAREALSKLNASLLQLATEIRAVLAN
jgi:hypothetical protein